MLKNYIKIAWRNLLSNKLFSFLNIAGLAIGMAVALLIGLWVWDELSFNRYHQHYDRIAQVMVNTTNGEQQYTGQTVSLPMGYALRDQFAADLKYVALVSGQGAHIAAIGDKQISQTGIWVQESFPSMFTLDMIAGKRDVLKDPSSILIARSLAKAIFGNTNPINAKLRIDNKYEMSVMGVYDDLPANTTMRDVKMLLPWNKYAAEESVRNAGTQWDNHMSKLFVQLQDHADIRQVGDKIKNVPTPHIKYSKEELLLQPMKNWHLYSLFKDGQLIGGRISMVWLIGVIGIFVLLLACINFMNLSTARSEKRSREVGIRKTIGSLRSQLILQFLSESLTMALLALTVAIVLVILVLPFFNELSDKMMVIPWTRPVFWISIITFTFFTGLVSGSYPAFYLSGFEPIKVLKGTFKMGRAASLPRKVLVVMQFTVSVALVIGTVVVYRQVQHASNRPVGYNRDRLITVDMNTPDIQQNFNALRNELLLSGVVADVALSNSAPTSVWSNNIVDWKGKDPAKVVSPGTIAVSHDFGNTLQWQILDGRDFSRDHISDTGAFILNESAVRVTGFKNPVGETIRWLNEDHEIVGVVKDMVMESPYQPIRPTIFHLNPGWARLITLRIKPNVALQDGLDKIAPLFRKYNPGSPFVYNFTDQEYAKKFADEKRIASLTSVFAGLAILISCLGLFGLASYIAEQRTREIGIRKVLGASVLTLLKMLSKDFVLLVIIACAIAVPVSSYFLNNWLEEYDYRTNVSWQLFGVATLGAIILTQLTITYQAIRAAIQNPVDSLKAD